MRAQHFWPPRRLPTTLLLPITIRQSTRSFLNSTAKPRIQLSHQQQQQYFFRRCFVKDGKTKSTAPLVAPGAPKPPKTDRLPVVPFVLIVVAGGFAFYLLTQSRKGWLFLAFTE